MLTGWVRMRVIIMAMSFAGAVVRGFHGQPTASRYGSSRTVAMSLDMSKSYRRAEPWKPGTATLEEVINVIGRWESSSEWKERTEFREDVIENLPLFFEDPAQGYTLQRYEMAQRMGMVERVAFLQNVAKLPFTNAALARSVGKTIEDFQDAPVANAAANIVFDALAQSKSGLLPPAVVDERRAAWLKSDGSFELGAFSGALSRAQAVVVSSTAILYIVTPGFALALIAKAAKLIP